VKPGDNVGDDLVSVCVTLASATVLSECCWSLETIFMWPSGSVTSCWSVDRKQMSILTHQISSIQYQYYLLCIPMLHGINSILILSYNCYLPCYFYLFQLVTDEWTDRHCTCSYNAHCIAMLCCQKKIQWVINKLAQSVRFYQSDENDKKIKVLDHTQIVINCVTVQSPILHKISWILNCALL